MFVKEDQMQRVKVPELDEYDNQSPISLVHPDIYLLMANQTTSVKESWKLFRRAAIKWFKKKVSKSS